MPYAGVRNRFDVLRRIGKFFVIPGDEVLPERRKELFPGPGNCAGVDLGAVVEIAGDEDHVGPHASERGNNALHESASVDVAEMDVGDQGGHATAPGRRQVRQLHRDSLHAQPAGVEQAVEADQDSQAKHNRSEHG